MKTDLRHITEDDVTFMIAPRLNAASRMASPQLAFDLLSETDPVRARVIAEELSRINDDRKYLVASIMKEVKQTLSKREEKQVIVIGNPKWQVGILGLVAGKLVEEYQKPVFVWGGHDENCFKGSCRGIGNSSVVSLMQSLPVNTLLSFGGHEMAGGFSIAQPEIHFLEERLIDVYEKSNTGIQEEKEVYAIDADITLSLLSRNIYDALDELAPFGVGNMKPTFICKAVIVGNVKQFGKTKEHLELQVNDGSGGGKKNKEFPKKAIDFFATPESYLCIPEVGKKIDLIATLERSWFLGREELRLRIVDIQKSS
jgi:single-stranded-DNA-specific exonuclease